MASIRTNLDRTDSQFLVNQIQGYNITSSIVAQELTGLYGAEVLTDMADILKAYKIYFKGSDFTVDAHEDTTPSQWSSKQVKSLIDKEARFMFAESPDIRLKDITSDSSDNSRIRANEELIKKVLRENNFNSKLIRAAKDCLIGKRIAIIANFNQSEGITVSFIPSLEFIYEVDEANSDKIVKFIQFFNINDTKDKGEQRIYKKKWYMENGICRVVEEIYDGRGFVVETLTPDQATKFKYIPAAVVINDGLTGDLLGISETEALEETESYYSKLANKDIDSLRKGTDQITYAIDASPKSTKNLSRAPGSFWDIESDVVREGATAQVGTLDNPMSYSPALDTTLLRLRTSMYGLVDVPDTSNEALQGMITSGKTMQAIYWGLMVRCNEKMLDWIPAFKHIVESILEGARLYPEIKNQYTTEAIVDDYEIIVENSYPIMQDEAEEKASDILEVEANVRSRKSYMKKWFGMTDVDVDNELEQILKEKEMLEHENYTAE